MSSSPRENRPLVASANENNEIDRAEAARLLRLARTADPVDADQLVDWAFAVLPDSPAIRRLKIQSSLAQHDVDLADALIAIGLLHRPTDPSLTFLRARSLFMQGEFERADQEIHLVLTRRLNHVGVQELAAQIAGARNDYSRAIRHHERVLDLQPNRSDVREMLVRDLLHISKVARAKAIFKSLTYAPPLLEAQVLRAEGRMLDAAMCLETATEKTTDASERDTLLYELIDLLESLGHWPRLIHLVSKLPSDTPRASYRASKAMLLIGRFSQCRELTDRFASRRRYEQEAQANRLVADALQCRISLSKNEIGQQTLAVDPAGLALLAENWQRGILGLIVSNQWSRRKSSVAHNSGVLQNLVQKALAVFNHELAEDEKGRSDMPTTEIQRNRALCLIRLGSPVLAAEAFSQSATHYYPPAKADLALPRAA